MADYITAEPLFDWEKGDFVIINGVPRLAVGKERIRNYTQKVLRTQLDRYKLYRGTGFGISTDKIIGKSVAQDYKQSEIRRNITEELLKDDSIISIENFSMKQEGTHLNISFTEITEYGAENIEEEI
ncbi:DUF2634 domain-containing protein [Lachnospiraceae bacterium MD329]|nr:DUF2634 domain-containing protein [Lachnospiraceae bacterium MD329]